jgi:hypothetical protein
MKRTLAVVALMLAAPAGADAATVEVAPWPDGTTILRYQAATGESNRLTLVTRLESRRIRIADPGAAIEAGDRCTAIDAHNVKCRPPSRPAWAALPEQAAVRLGDGDDVLQADRAGPIFYSAPGFVAHGGVGDDVLEGPDEVTTLNGGGGRDRLIGGGGLTTFVDGDDPFAPDADVMVGGPSFDTVSYAGRLRSVSVDLRGGRAGEPGEGDVVSGIEAAEGGAAPDRLAGGNSMRGNGGDDVVAGDGMRHGIDTLLGGRGNDRLVGDAGSDQLSGGAGIDVLRCGEGLDVVTNPVAGELIGPGCERLRRAVGEVYGVTVMPRLSVTRRAVAFSTSCPRDEDVIAVPCGGTVEMRNAAGRLLGRGTFAVLDGDNERGPVAARLTARGRRAVARSNGTVATISLHGDDFPRIAWDARLKR